MNYFRQNREQLLRMFFCVGIAAFVLVFLASAATAQTTIFKANNTTALETTAAWTNSTAGAGGNPLGVNATYIGTIDSTLAAGNAALTLGGTMTIGGLKILNPGAALTINGTGAIRTLNIGNATFANGGGIDMSNATVGLTLGSNIATVLQGTTQTWTIGNATSHPAFVDNGTLNNNGLTLAIAGNGTASFAGVISGSGEFYQQSANTTTLSGQNTMSGNVYLTSGTLVLTNNGTAGVGSSLGINNFFDISGGNLNTGATAVSIATNNKIVIYDNFTFVGSNNLNLGTGNVFLANDATISVTANTVTFGGNITDGYNGTSNAWSNGLSITKTGAGGIALNGTNQFSGNFNMQAGTLTLNSNLSLQNATLNYTGGTISFGSLTNATLGGLAGTTALALPTNFALTLNTGTYDSGNYNAALSGTNVSINIGGNGTQIFSGANTFTTNATNFVTLNSGTLVLNSAAALGAVNATNANLKINGGSIDTTAATTTLSNYLQNWNGDFTYIGTGNLNMGTGAITLAASRTVTVSANTLTLGGAIGGAFSLTKNGAGTLVLSGASGYTGGFTLNAGTLVINTNGSASTGALGNNGTFTINGGSIDTTIANTNVTTVNPIAMNGDFTFVGTGNLNLGTGAVTMSASRTITTSASTLTIGGVIGGGGFSLTKNGSGNLVLSGNNTYSGGTVINGGTLSVNIINAGGTNSGLGSSSAAAANLIINGGTLQYVGSTAASTNRLLTVGPNNATIDASGTNTLTFSNTGAVVFSSSSDPANITFTGSNTSTNTFNLVIGDSGTGANVTTVLKSGTGEWVLNATNTYSGGTILSTGTLAIKTAGALGTGLLTINGGSLDNTNGSALTLSGNNAQAWNSSWTYVGSNALSMNTGNVALNASITLTVTASTLTVGGVISDSGYGYSLSKAGSGTLVLSGANTYSGNTNVSAGTLTLGSNVALQNSTLNYTGGTISFGTLTNATLGGLAGSTNLAINNTTPAGVAVTLNTALGSANTYSGILSGAGSISMNGSGTETLSGASTYTGTTTVNSGTLVLSGARTGTAGVTTLAGGTLVLNNNGTATTGVFGNNGTFTITGGNLDTTVTNTNITTVDPQNWNGNFTFIGTGNLNMGTGGVTLGATRTVSVNANTLTVGGVITDGASTFGLTKAGSGNLVLTGTSTYNGTTSVTAGTLTLDFSTKGNNTVGVVDASSALSLSGGTLNIIGVSGTGDTNTQTFSATTIAAGNSTISGSMAVGSATGLLIKLGTVTRQAGGTVNVVKPVAGNVNGTMSTTNNVVTQNGIAYMTVSGTDWANLTAGNVTAIAAASYVNNTANNTWAATQNLRISSGITMSAARSLNTLLYNGTTATTLNLGGFALTMNAGGILMSSNATNTFTISNGSLQGQASANDELVIIQNSASALTINANIVNNGSNGTIVTKSGSGQLVLNGTNTYSGNTYLNSGTLTVGSSTALGATASNLVIDGGSLDANTATTLANNNGQIWNDNFTFVGSNTLNMGTGNVAMNGNIILTTTASTLTVGGNISGAFSLTKNGSGNLVLTNAGSTFSGNVYINGGLLEASGNNALGSASKSVIVASGAALQLDNNFDTSGAGFLTGSSNGSMLTINGTGISSGGALVNGNGTAQWAGNVTLAGDASIGGGSTASGFLTVGDDNVYSSTLALGTKNLTIVGGATTTVNVAANITGTGNVTISTAGTVIYSSPGNGYLGTTNITNGTLVLDTVDHGTPQPVGNEAINGNIIIGDGIGSGNTAILQMSNGSVLDQKRNSIAATSNVIINSDGKFFVDGQDQTIANLTMNSGYIDTRLDSTHLGILTVTGNTTILSNALSAVIDGNLNLSNSVGNATNLFTVASGGNVNGDLIISALISGGSIVKAGAGNMVLSGNGNISSYTGTTEVQAGTLNIQASSSANVTGNIGALGAADGSLGEGTTVDSGAKLQLQGGVTVSNETLVLNGNGVSGTDGALQSLAGANVWDGTLNNITVASNASINTTAGSLQISSNVTTNATAATLTFNGAGTTTVSGTINNGLSLAMNGSGTLVLNGSTSNSYTGTTTINSGTVEMNKNAGTVAVSGSTITINSGGTLLSDASENIGNGVNMVLNGGTWGTNAAASSITENLNTLTLTATSNLNLGATSNVIQFTDSSAKTWAGDSVLYINSWNGLYAGGGTDQVYFGTSSAGLQGTSYTGQLGEIIFVNPTIDGVAQSTNFHAIILSTGEVVPFRAAPEASTVVAGAALGALALLREWRRRKSVVSTNVK